MRLAASEAMLTMRPPPRSRMGRIAAREQLKVPPRLTSTILSHSACDMSSTRRGRPKPALFTRRSSPPSSATARATMACAWLSSATLAVTTTARRPSARTSSATVRARSSSRSFTATSAPSRASPSARPRPIPCPAPVTSETLPCCSMARLPGSSRSLLVLHAAHDAGRDLVGVHPHVEQRRPRILEEARHRPVEIVERFHPDTLDAEPRGHAGEIDVPETAGEKVPLPEELLVRAHGAEHPVRQDHPKHRRALRGGRLELHAVHEEAAVPRHAHDGRLRARELQDR